MEAVCTHRSTSSSETPSSRNWSTLTGQSSTCPKGVRSPQGFAMRSVTILLLSLSLARMSVPFFNPFEPQFSSECHHDHGLREHHKDAYLRKGRWVLAAAVVLGWVVGLLTEIPEVAIAVLTAFLAGGVI